MSDAFDLYMFDSPGASPSAVAAPTSSGPIGPAGAGDGVNVTSAYAQPSYDTSYLYTPTSAQPGGSEFVAPAGYTPTFDFSSFSPYQYGSGQETSLSPPGSSASYYGYTPPVTSSFGAAGGGYVPTPISRPLGLDISAATGGAVAPSPTPTSQVTPDQKQQQGGLGGLLNQLGGLKGLTSAAGGLMGYLANQRAQQQAEDVGNQIKAAYQNAAQQTQQLAQPYMTAGGPQLSMALQGSLSPAQQQIFQAQQAQLAQNAVRTGGVGAIQTAAAEQAMYQQALQNQQAMALQLLSPGNQLMTTAIQQQLQGTTQGLTTTLQYQNMANEAAAKLFQQLGSIGASTPQSQSNAGVP